MRGFPITCSLPLDPAKPRLGLLVRAICNVCPPTSNGRAATSRCVGPRCVDRRLQRSRIRDRLALRWTVGPATLRSRRRGRRNVSDRGTGTRRWRPASWDCRHASDSQAPLCATAPGKPLQSVRKRVVRLGEFPEGVHHLLADVLEAHAGESCRPPRRAACGAGAELAAELVGDERARGDANARVYEANLELSRLDHPVPKLPALLGHTPTRPICRAFRR